MPHPRRDVSIVPGRVQTLYPHVVEEPEQAFRNCWWRDLYEPCPRNMAILCSSSVSASRAKTLTDSWTKHQSELNAFNLEQGRMKRRSSKGALSTASHAPNDWVVLFQLPITADGL